MEKFREILVDIQRHIESDTDMDNSRLKQLWNDLSFAITDHEAVNTAVCEPEQEPVVTMYKYFVSFAYDNGYENGFWNTILNYEKLFNSIEILRDAEEYIMVLKNFKSVSILSFILLDTEPK